MRVYFCVVLKCSLRDMEIKLKCGETGSLSALHPSHKVLGGIAFEL